MSKHDTVCDTSKLCAAHITKNKKMKNKQVKLPALLPDRHPIADFFICDIMDAVPKDDMASMEHPLFSLSTKPDMKERLYKHNDDSILIIPSGKGLATIHDKDVLIFCISQIMAKKNRGEQVSRTVHLKAFDLLVGVNKTTNGNGYKWLKEALNRLRGTTINTSIKTNGVSIEEGFGFIDKWHIVTKNEQSERMISLSVTLSEWTFNSILGNEVLTINRDYFRLRKSIERRIYEIARKHCGTSKKWSIGLKLLQKKTGSLASLREFRRTLNMVIKNQHLPDYEVTMLDDMITFKSRLNIQRIKTKELGSNFPYILQIETFEKAKKAAPRYDIYYLQEEWKTFWLVNGKHEIINPDKAFIGFCKKRYQDEPNP